MRLNVWRLEFGRPSQLQACPLLISLIWIHTFTQLPPQKFTKAIVRFVTWVTYFLFSTPGAWPLTSWWTLNISSIPGHFRAERAPRALSNRATVTRRGRKRIKWKYTGQIIHVSYKKSSHILNQKEVNIFKSYASGILIPSPLTLLFLSLLCLWVSLLLCSAPPGSLHISATPCPGQWTLGWRSLGPPAPLPSAGSVTRPGTGGPRSSLINTELKWKGV